ncbi:MAG: hypothetical protein AB7F99_15120 [Vicinamibacterales bacterium]
MKTSARYVLSAAGAVIVCFTVACSQSSPASPSDTSGLGAVGLQSGTTIRGSVSGGTGGSNLGAQLMPSAVKVCVAGTDNCDLADGDGDFELKGDFSGDVQLEFTGPDGTVNLTVPGVVAGETVTVIVDLFGTTGELEIESRSDDDDSEGDDVSEDDVSEDDVSEDDVSGDDLSEDDISEDDVSEDDISKDDDSEDDVSEDDDSEDDLSEDDDSEDDGQDATAGV